MKFFGLLFSVLLMNTSFATDIGCWQEDSDIGDITMYGIESGEARAYIKDEKGEYVVPNGSKMFIERLVVQTESLSSVSNIPVNSSEEIFKYFSQLVKKYSNTSSNEPSTLIIYMDFTSLDSGEKISIAYLVPKNAYSEGRNEGFTGGTVFVMNQDKEKLVHKTNCFFQTKSDGLE